MGFSLEHSFVVKAPAERVWEFLTDPMQVAPALPGAAITEKVSDQTYNGTITVKVGPVSARYRGTVRFESLDVKARTARIVASGQETSGRGGADLKMSSRLTPRSPEETEVSLSSEVNVTGILVQFGRGMIQDVSNQMLARFTEAMRAQLEPSAATAPAPGAPSPSTPAAAAAAPPVELLSFGGRILARAFLRMLRRPWFWIMALVVILLLWLIKR